MVFNVTFNNISALALYHTMLYRVHIAMSVILTDNFSRVYIYISHVTLSSNICISITCNSSIIICASKRRNYFNMRTIYSMHNNLAKTIGG